MTPQTARLLTIDPAVDFFPETPNVDGFSRRSPALLEMRSRIRHVAPYYRAVLITGKTGTGKELVARKLHRLSPASNGRFVAVNCSAIVETLFESELFGHVHGAFTGAGQDKTGLFEAADKGTIFLDEIGDMPLNAQAKLLRTLQNQEITPVGSLTPRRVNVRVIAATNADLSALIADGQFREDLYYRIAMVEIRTPPLSERMEDLPLLATHIVEKFSREFQRDIRGLTAGAVAVLNRHSWRGNVRELENVLGHGCMMATSDMIDLEDLPEYLCSYEGRSVNPIPSNDLVLDMNEKHLLEIALARTHGNKSKAARVLGIGRDRLRYKIRKHGL